MGGKTKPVAIRIKQRELPRSPRRIADVIDRRYASGTELGQAVIGIRHDEIHGAARLAITGMLSKKYRLSAARQLQEDRKAGLELMFPIDAKSQTVEIKEPASRKLGDSQLGNDGLLHE